MKKPSSIIIIPDKILSEVTQRVTSFEDEITSQIKGMRRILKSHDGAGLAANQIGVANRVIVVELEEEKNSIPFQAFVNPEIVESSAEAESMEEGCLSVPQIELPVKRAKKIKIRFQDSEGKKRKLAAKGLLSRILQHEIDHLNGILFTDRIRKQYLFAHPELKNLKILFFGSGHFGADILKGLILLGLKIDIITEKGKPAGRHQIVKATPVAEIAKRFGKNYLEIESFSSERTRASITKADLIICADFGKKIPENILKLAKISAINLHPSLLPKYRGPTPIQTAILDGAKTTGATIIEMSPEIDKGTILAQVETKTSPTDNTLTLTARLSTLGLKLLFEALPLIAKKELKELAQDETKATLTHKFQKSDGEIDWKKTPKQIERQIRAFTPWPGSYTFLPDGKRLLIHQSHLVGEGKLVLDKVQVEGGKPMKWKEFLRGYRGEKPDWFRKFK